MKYHFAYRVFLPIILLFSVVNASVEQATSEALLTNASKCPGAQFDIPTAGLLGAPYKDPVGGVPGYSDVHTGIDILGNVGDDIYAAYHGEVERVTSSSISIWHPDLGVRTYYSHLSDVVIALGPVARGTVIGKKGSAGTDFVHLHFSVSKRGLDERYL